MALSFAGTNCIRFGSQGDALTGPQKITYIRWVGATTAGHKCEMTDTAGNVLFSSEADGANFLDIQPLYQRRTGITLSDLDSGSVLVYRD